MKTGSIQYTWIKTRKEGSTLIEEQIPLNLRTFNLFHAKLFKNKMLGLLKMKYYCLRQFRNGKAESGWD